MTFNIWTLNCQGLNNHKKKDALNALLNRFNPSIVCLQETNINPHMHDSLTFNNYKTFYNPSLTLGSGTIFLIRNSINVITTNVLIPSKLHSIELTLNGETFYILNCHFPFDNNISMQFISTLKSHINNITNKKNVILLGDWNFVLNNDLDRLNSNENRKQVCIAFNDLISTFNLFDSYRFLNPNGKDM